MKARWRRQRIPAVQKVSVRGAGSVWSSDPPWWIRDVLVALLIGGLLLWGQSNIDNFRSDREAAAAERLATEADRRENLRFVRERSGPQEIERPFRSMDLTEQTLSGLTLRGADFSSASLARTDFSYAALDGAKFGFTDLSGSELVGSILPSAYLGTANLQRASFAYANLHRANLESSVADGATFEGTILTNASLEGASFRGAFFSGADLSGADMDRTDFTGADLSDAVMVGVIMDDPPCYDSSAEWPRGFRPPESDPETCLHTRIVRERTLN